MRSTALAPRRGRIRPLLEAGIAPAKSLSLSFTGMRVTRHDGKSPYHLVGVKPDVQAAPTVAGLRAGQHDVLDRGIALMRGK